MTWSRRWKAAIAPWLISMFTCIPKHRVRHSLGYNAMLKHRVRHSLGHDAEAQSHAQPQMTSLCAASQSLPGHGENPGVRNLALGIPWQTLGLGVWSKGDCRQLTFTSTHPLNHPCLPSSTPTTILSLGSPGLPATQEASQASLLSSLVPLPLLIAGRTLKAASALTFLLSFSKLFYLPPPP